MELTSIPLLNLKVVKEKDIVYNSICVNSPEKVLDIARQMEIDTQDVESFYIFTLDTKNKVSGIFEVSRGTINASIVHPREVYKRAILQSANAIILLHNHPSGDTRPSNEDIAITNRLVECGKLIGIEVLDHIIIGDSYYSFKAEDKI